MLGRPIKVSARWCYCISSALLVCVTAPEAATLTQAQWHAQGGIARLELLLSETVAYRIETLTDPHRLVIELPRTRAATPIPILAKQMAAHGTLGSIMRGGKDLRLVWTTATALKPKTVVSKTKKGSRLIVEWSLPAAAARAAVSTKVTPVNVKPVVKSVNKRLPALRPVMVAIDAGHGGEDPGALGSLGTREKDITLRVARLLAERIRREQAMKAYLVRDGDHFIPLRSRMKRARAKQADLFVSVHADAAENTRATGASVFTLSGRGATSVAAHWLANKENAADLIGGVSLDGKDNALASVLFDLAQSATSEASYDAGQAVLQQLQKLGDVHQVQVQYAGFAVLKSPDIPSILVETAFISNRDEERKLRSPHYQAQLAEAIFAGVRRYFERNPPPGTMYAEVRRHTIEPGDTLLKLAKQYQVSVEAIRAQNGLAQKPLRPGQVLTIPPLSERAMAGKPLS